MHMVPLRAKLMFMYYNILDGDLCQKPVNFYALKSVYFAKVQSYCLSIEMVLSNTK